MGHAAHGRRQEGQVAVGAGRSPVAGEEGQDAARLNVAFDGQDRLAAQWKGVGQEERLVAGEVGRAEFAGRDHGDGVAAAGGQGRAEELDRLGRTGDQDRQTVADAQQEAEGVVARQGVGGRAELGGPEARRQTRQHQFHRRLAIGLNEHAAVERLRSAVAGEVERQLPRRSRPAELDGEARLLPGEQEGRGQRDGGGPGVLGSFGAAEQDEEGDAVAVLAGDDAAAGRRLAGIVGGRAESVPGQRLAVGQDVDLAFQPRVALLVERLEGLGDGGVDRRASMAPGDAADRLERGGMRGRRALDQRLRRVRREIDADTVAGAEALD